MLSYVTKKLTIRVNIASIAILCWRNDAPRENGGKNEKTLFSSVKNTCKCIKMFLLQITEPLLQCRKWE